MMLVTSLGREPLHWTTEFNSSPESNQASQAGAMYGRTPVRVLEATGNPKISAILGYDTR
jgi:hypothetical protein